MKILVHGTVISLGFTLRLLSVKMKTCVVQLRKEEIEGVVTGLPSNRAHGPDGITGEFYRHCWTMVKEDCVAAVRYFFQH